jgi:hypothetical protein
MTNAATKTKPAKTEKVSNTKKKTSKKSASTKVNTKATKTKATKKVEKPVVANTETSIVVLETTLKEKTETPAVEVVQEVTEIETPIIQEETSSNVEEPENEEEARKLEGAELKEAIMNQENQMKVIITRSTHGKTQQRVCGKRKFKNPYGHFYGTIGSKIDRMIEHGAFTKNQIQAYAGTKMSKVNSHIAHLRRDIGKVIILDDKKKVKFG